jgi:hypothetical protein
MVYWLRRARKIKEDFCVVYFVVGGGGWRKRNATRRSGHEWMSTAVWLTVIKLSFTQDDYFFFFARSLPTSVNAPVHDFSFCVACVKDITFTWCGKKKGLQIEADYEKKYCFDTDSIISMKRGFKTRCKKEPVNLGESEVAKSLLIGKTIWRSASKQQSWLSA